MNIRTGSILHSRADSIFPLGILKFFLLLVFVAAVTCEVVAQSAAGAIVITEKQEGQVVSIKKGQTVRIELPALLGAGYSWRFSSDNPRVAVLASAPEVLPSNKIGSSETQVFHVRILRAGEAHLQLDYVRPWERNVSPQKIFQVTLHSRVKKN